MSRSDLTAEDIVRTLDMQPHPEGGWFVETFRDGDETARGKSTAIYYLLKAGQRSHWHRVRDAAEVWHFYLGGPLRLKISDGKGIEEVRLGTNLRLGERPQAVVPADAWQSAEPIGDYTLVGCTVAPAFQFENFEMAPPGWEPS